MLSRKRLPFLNSIPFTRPSPDSGAIGDSKDKNIPLSHKLAVPGTYSEFVKDGHLFEEQIRQRKAYARMTAELLPPPSIEAQEAYLRGGSLWATQAERYRKDHPYKSLNELNADHGLLNLQFYPIFK